MIKNHLKLAWRHLQRNRLYTFINVLGLAIGIAACLVIYLIVSHELSFDTFRQDRDRIYRVYTSFSGSFTNKNRGIATAVGPWIQDNVSGIAHQARFFTGGMEVIPLSELGKPMDKGRQNNIAITEPGFFDIFSDYRWLSGNPETALSSSHQVVLTEDQAKLYFGDANPIAAVGRELYYSDSVRLTVSGILATPQQPTDLYFTDFISWSTIDNSVWKENYDTDNLGSTTSSAQLFLKLLPGKAPEEITAQFTPLEEEYAQEQAKYKFRADYELQPFEELHFSSEMGIFDGSRSSAHLPTLYVLIGVAILLLLAAAINFINLETAQAVRRAKEVGVRKTMGGSRSDLIGQFLGQTFVLTALAMISGLLLTKGAIWYFTDFVPEGVELDLTEPSQLGFIFGTTFLVTLLAGAYPAFVLSSFRPALALKDRIGARGHRSGSVTLRRGLVVFQFIIAQVLIFGTLTVGQQIRYMLEKDMGFDKDAIVYFYVPWRDTTSNRHLLVEQLRQWPEIQAISLHDSPPAINGYSSSVMKHKVNGEEKQYNVHRKFGDTAYIDLYGMTLLAGRNIMHSDTVKELIINETLARQMGHEQAIDAVGESLILEDKSLPIVGVVSDFHMQSMHDEIQPSAIAGHNKGGTVSLKLASKGMQAGQVNEILTRLEDVWSDFYAEQPFNHHFMDETIVSFYEAEQRTAKLVRTATLIAVLISCLGLFGLVSFAANQRTKEIGVRKVLGATVANIVSLLSREFLWLVLVAFAIAAPLGWWFAGRWLDDFAYRTHIPWWLFALCGGLALLVAFLTMSIQSIRAALNNPVDSLRSE